LSSKRHGRGDDLLEIRSSANAVGRIIEPERTRVARPAICESADGDVRAAVAPGPVDEAHAG